MKQLKEPFHSSDCGCNGGASPYYSGSGCADPVICSDAYISLVAVPRVKIIGVKPGTTCQSFLEQTKRGFVFSDGAGLGFYVEDQPSLTLPILNALTGPGAYETPSPFQFLIAGVGGSAPHAWKFITGKTGEEGIVYFDGNAFIMKAASQVGGSSSPCTSETTALEVSLFGCVPTGLLDANNEPTFYTRRLRTEASRVIVGVEAVDGTRGAKSLPVTENLEHPKAKIPEFRSRSFQKIDGSGNDIADGMDTRANTGLGSDAELVLYSPSRKEFYAPPERTKIGTSYSGNVSVSSTGSWETMGSHARALDVQVNYPDVFIAFQIEADTPSDNLSCDYALFIDGSFAFEWNIKGQKDVSLTTLRTGLSLGTHSFTIRSRRSAGAVALTIKNSSLNIFTVI